RLLVSGFHNAEARGLHSLVDQRHYQVHNHDGVAHALGIGAEVADEHRQQAAAQAEDQLAGLGDGGGGVVSGH
ncbi:DNA binding domain, excisionase family, partial [Dysosmobacter welbionis]